MSSVAQRFRYRRSGSAPSSKMGLRSCLFAFDDRKRDPVLGPSQVLDAIRVNHAKIPRVARGRQQPQVFFDVGGDAVEIPFVHRLAERVPQHRIPEVRVLKPSFFSRFAGSLDYRIDKPVRRKTIEGVVLLFARREDIGKGIEFGVEEIGISVARRMGGKLQDGRVGASRRQIDVTIGGVVEAQEVFFQALRKQGREEHFRDGAYLVGAVLGRDGHAVAPEAPDVVDAFFVRRNG